MAQQSFENLASIGGHKFPARPSRILCASSISPLSCTGTNCSQSIQNGRNLFIDVAKCFVCPTPSMTTGPSYVAALSNVQANLFSDLLIHHMGSGLADGVFQGGQARINSARLHSGGSASGCSSCMTGGLPIS